MRILYAVQRYHDSIVGGSENACREFSERLVRSGHTVEVVTSCALDYRTWKNELPAGTTELNGVTIHRLPVVTERSKTMEDEIFRKAFEGPRPLSFSEQDAWASATGPDLEDYEEWLLDNSERFDVAIFMTYLYATTTRGLPTLKGKLPVILQPTAHDESPIWLTKFDYLFELADHIVCFSPEEQSFINRRFRRVAGTSVVGFGFDPVESEVVSLAKPLSDYLVYVGRWDHAKGVDHLIDYVEFCRTTLSTDIKLVIVGESPEATFPDWVITTGFVTEQEKRQILRDAVALIQPSFFESFSIVLFEAWNQETPVIVQERCDVLKGQVVRSGGGRLFNSKKEFRSVVEEFLTNSELRTLLGRNGKSFVERSTSWDDVIEKFENALNICNFSNGHGLDYFS